ncbi:MAG: PorV/PorQ family protein [bacterium]|nr:PorV/PorQ family protein [bacterium]
MNKLSVIILIILILSSTFRPVQADDAGVTGNAFLKIGMGARAAGMGGAFCAIADDASAGYWNPAGLCGIEKQELLFMHTKWLADIASEYIAFAKPIDDDTSLGASIIFLHAEDMARNRQAQETGKFNNHDACFSLSYASKKGSIDWGLTPKIIHRQLKDETAVSVGLDMGSRYINDNLSFGATIQNLGTKIKLGEEASPSPLALNLGVGYKMSTENDSLTIAGDINKPIDSNPSLSLGAEYNYDNWIMARVGARMGPVKQGLSFGFGVLSHDYRFDYAFTSFDDLGLTHRAAVTRCFEIVSRGDTEVAKVVEGEKGKKGREQVLEVRPAVLVSDASEVETAPEIVSHRDAKGTKEIATLASDESEKTLSLTEPARVEEIARTTAPFEPELLQPCVFIFPDTRVFSPDGDGTLDSVAFILRTIIQTQVIRWELRIVDRNNNTINVFAGHGMPLETLIWDGRNKSGNIVSSGSYFCLLSVTDEKGKIWTSSKEIIVVE